MRSVLAMLLAAMAMLFGCADGEIGVGPRGPAGPKGNPGPPGPPGSSISSMYSSGARIKATVGTTPDGAAMFVGWYDSERQEECNFFLTTRDGMKRCVPDSSAALAYESGYFADSACSIPAAPYLHCGIARYVFVLIADQCDSYRLLIHDAAPMDEDAPIYARTQGGCTTTNRVHNSDYYSAGAEIAPDRFQSMTVSTR